MSGARAGLLPVALAALVALVVPAARAAGDPEGAEQQYRAARRLVAEGSSEARPALRQVLELDPEGELVDDVLVDLALLESPPLWPESIRGLDPRASTRALALVDEALRRFPSGNRAPQARYHRALLRLEPAATYSPSDARVDLTAVATGGSDWAGAARYALAWLDERAGKDERAFEGYQRMLVDESAAAGGVRARVGAARVLLRQGAFGAAARRLQEAIDGGVADDAGAMPLRELAVRALLREAGAADRSRAVRTLTGTRSPSGLAATAAGGALVADPRQSRVLELGPDGDRVGEWSLDDLQAVAADAAGRAYAAAGSTLYRLERGPTAAPVAALGDYAPLSQLVADGAGGFWLLERRGRRIGRVEPGAGGPTPFWEADGARLTAITWNGRRLVAIDARSRGVVAIERDGSSRTLIERSPIRVVAVAADASGRVALLDGKSGSVAFLSGDGRLEPPAETGVALSGPVALAIGPEGELHLLDREGVWTLLR